MSGSASGTREATRSIFLRIAETCDLPPLPAVAARAMTLARDPDASAADLARLVGTDTALAARVLKISRSVTYLRQQPPRTLQEAVVVVGFQALRKILVAASARSTHRGDDPIATRLWEHALATALAADELAAAAREPRGGDAFIAGLLHDVGRLVFHLSDPAAYARLALGAEELESEIFGVTHAAVGGCLAEKWGLDAEVVDAVMLHHAGDAGGLAARVGLADRIAHRIGYGSMPAPAPGADTDADGALASAGDPSAATPPEAALLEGIASRVAGSFASERTLFE
jgi:HD-like signal output (HDOD) protein